MPNKQQRSCTTMKVGRIICMQIPVLQMQWRFTVSRYCSRGLLKSKLIGTVFAEYSFLLNIICLIIVPGGYYRVLPACLKFCSIVAWIMLCLHMFGV